MVSDVNDIFLYITLNTCFTPFNTQIYFLFLLYLLYTLFLLVNPSKFEIFYSPLGEPLRNTWPKHINNLHLNKKILTMDQIHE